MRTYLEPLHKITKTGATQLCNISFEDDTFYVEFGQLNGKMQTQSTVCTAKNIGKKNEVYPRDQAKLEAYAKHRSKIKEGYSLVSEESMSEVKLPQKVKIYQDNKHLVDYGHCTASPKLNGVNGEFRLIGDELKLYSRGGDEYPMIEHLHDDIKQLLIAINETSLNVELYKHGWHLQDITAAVKKFKPDTREFPTSQIEAHIFEVPSRNDSYLDAIARIAISRIGEALLDNLSTKIDIIPYYIVHSEEEVEAKFNYWTNKGYEGLIVRNNKVEYNYNERSSDVFKYKKPLDGEYRIIGYKVDKLGHPVLLCEIEPEGLTFSVKPAGTDEFRRDILNNMEYYINKWYKIEYETLSKDRIPLKPVGICLRNCDDLGNPLE